MYFTLVKLREALDVTSIKFRPVRKHEKLVVHKTPYLNRWHWRLISVFITRGVGGTPQNSWWGVPPGFPNPDPISDQNMPFSIPLLQTWPLKSIPVFSPDIYVYKGLSYVIIA